MKLLKEVFKMKLKKRLSHLNLFLNILLVFMTLLFIMNFSVLLMGESISNMQVILITLIDLIVLGGYIMIILTFKKVIKSLLSKDLFSSDNIIYFKKISYYIFVVGSLYAIATYPEATYSRLEIMITSYGSLKPIFFIYMLLGTFSLILGDIFRIAKEIKDENDLTV